MLPHRRLVYALGAVLLLSACGYTEQEMAAKQREIETLAAQLHSREHASIPACSTKAPSTTLPRARVLATR